jgi:lysophospholipase L1-like esterase
MEGNQLFGRVPYGDSAATKNTIPSSFVKITEDKYRVLNFGETSYNPFQGYLFLKLQTIKQNINPDVIVSYDGVNSGGSIFGHNREKQIKEIMKGEDSEDKEKEEEKLSLKNFFWNPMQILASKIKSKFNAEDTKKEYKEEPITDDKVRNYARMLLNDWLQIQKMAEEKNSEFIAILQPNAFVGSPKTKHLNLKDKKKRNWDTYYQKLYSQILKLIKQEPKYQKLNDNFLNLTDAFDNDEYIYIDFCHVSPNGNKIIAKKIYDYIKNKDSIDKSL